MISKREAHNGYRVRASAFVLAKISVTSPRKLSETNNNKYPTYILFDFENRSTDQSVRNGVDFVSGESSTFDAPCRIVSSTGALKLKAVPETMVVVGGGVIGLEMGSVWSRLGSQVTVLEYLPNILPTVDGDVRKAFQRTLTKQGFAFQLGQKVLSSEVLENGKVRLTYEAVKDGKVSEIEADIVLVSTGRRPFTGTVFHPG